MLLVTGAVCGTVPPEMAKFVVEGGDPTLLGVDVPDEGYFDACLLLCCCCFE